MSEFVVLPPQDKKLPPLNVEVAATFVRRFCGLMGRREHLKNKGLLIYPCNSIHMCFMFFPIDAVFLDRDFRILKLYRGLYPWVGMGFCLKAWGVLELAAGTIDAYGWQVGDKLETMFPSGISR